MVAFYHVPGPWPSSSLCYLSNQHDCVYISILERLLAQEKSLKSVCPLARAISYEKACCYLIRDSDVIYAYSLGGRRGFPSFISICV